MFISKKLQGSFEKTKETLEGFVQDISQVSQDIRFLELILKNYALHSPFHSLFAHEVIVVPGYQGESAELEHHSYEFVSWEINEKQKKSSFRIFYKKFEARFLQGDPASHISCPVPKDAKLQENRPLVETSVSTRLKIYPFLPMFLEKLAEELSRHQTKLDFTKFRQGIDKFEKTMKTKKKN
jgi:hypothetical protein